MVWPDPVPVVLESSRPRRRYHSDYNPRMMVDEGAVPQVINSTYPRPWSRRHHRPNRIDEDLDPVVSNSWGPHPRHHDEQQPYIWESDPPLYKDAKPALHMRSEVPRPRLNNDQPESPLRPRLASGSRHFRHARSQYSESAPPLYKGAKPALHTRSEVPRPRLKNDEPESPLRPRLASGSRHFRHAQYQYSDSDISNPQVLRPSARHYGSRKQEASRRSLDGDFGDVLYPGNLSSEEETGTRLAFDFPFRSNSPSIEASRSSQSNFKDPNKEVRNSSKKNAGKLEAFKEESYKFSRSYYSGSTYTRGDSVADLHLSQEQGTTAIDPAPSLRWIHLQSLYPSFDSFLEYVAQMQILDEDERKNTAALLETVGDKHEMPIMTPKGVSGRYMQPNLTARTFQLLITCAHLQLPDIQRGLINMKPSPHPTQEAKQNCLRIYDGGGNRAWVLLVRDCITWFEFSANFEDLTGNFDDEFEVVDDGVIRTSDDWPALIERAQRTTIELILRPKRLKGMNHPGRNYVPQTSGRPQRQAAYHQNANGLLIPPGTLPGDGAYYHNRFGGNDLIIKSIESDSSLNETEKEVSQSDFAKIPGKKRRSRSSLSARSKKTLNLDKVHKSSPMLSPLSTTPASGADLKDESVETKHKGPADFDSFHVFSWSMAIPSSIDSSEGERNETRSKSPRPATGVKAFNIDKDGLQNLLEKMNHFLSKTKHANRRTRRTYHKCPVHLLEEVENLLKVDKKSAFTSRKSGSGLDQRPPDKWAWESVKEKPVSPEERSECSDDREAKPYFHPPRQEEPDSEVSNSDVGHLGYDFDLGRQRSFVRDAKKLFALFLPLESSSEMVSKYWGAVFGLIADHHRFIRLRASFEDSGMWVIWNRCLKLVNIIMKDMSKGRAPMPWKISLPNSLGEAWLHLVLCFTAIDAEEYGIAANELNEFYGLLSRGRKELIRSVIPRPLHEKEAVLPLGIISLLVKALMRDTTHISGLPDICSTYDEYLSNLTREVGLKPYSRDHQEQFVQLSQELECIVRTLDDQLTCLTDLRNYIDRNSMVTSTHYHHEREAYIIQDCIDSVRARLQMFNGISRSAQDLEKYNIQRIESNKDRQEAAILVFTAVTIIFLPLSFVASVFGMNTYDIRNMNTRQWIFWACAIPLTIAVLAASLLIVRKVEPLRQLWGYLLDQGIESRRQRQRRQIRDLDEMDD